MLCRHVLLLEVKKGVIFSEGKMELTNWSNYAHSTRYFAAGDSLRSYTPSWRTICRYYLKKKKGDKFAFDSFYRMVCLSGELLRDYVSILIKW